jgi:hypothetical protein
MMLVCVQGAKLGIYNRLLRPPHELKGRLAVFRNGRSDDTISSKSSERERGLMDDRYLLFHQMAGSSQFNHIESG